MRKDPEIDIDRVRVAVVTSGFLPSLLTHLPAWTALIGQRDIAPREPISKCSG
jgi:hypothetical protein